MKCYLSREECLIIMPQGVTEDSHKRKDIRRWIYFIHTHTHIAFKLIHVGAYHD